MAEQEDDVVETTPKKPARKRTRATGTKKSASSAPKKQRSSSASAASKTAEKKAVPSESKEDGSEDLWDQTAESLSKVDWGLRGRHIFRLVLMLFAAVAAELSVLVIYFLTAVHFFYTLVMGQKLDELNTVCGRFTVYVKQLLDFISYRSDEPLFPFAPFPDADDAD